MYAAFSHDSLAVIGVNSSSSAGWLNTYSTQKAITFPFIYDQTGSLFNSYEVGATYGNIPPTFVIIDANGIVRYRIDAQYSRAAEMSAKVRELLASQ